jgi:hypothetical protein
MKKQLIAALLMGLGLVSINIQPSGAYPQNNAARKNTTIALKNMSGYVAEYNVTYFQPQNIGGHYVPMPKVETGQMSLGFFKQLTVPADAKNITFRVRAIGRGDYVINEAVSDNCLSFTVKGTVFNPHRDRFTCFPG